MTGGQAIPGYIGPEVTNVQAKLDKVSEMAVRVEKLEENGMTFERVDKIVNGLRDSLKLNVILPLAEKIDAVVVDSAMLVTKPDLDLKLGMLQKDIDATKPPSPWKVAAGLVTTGITVIGIVATMVWSIASRINDIAIENALRKMQVDGLLADRTRLESEVQSLQSKVDQLLLAKMRP